MNQEIIQKFQNKRIKLVLNGDFCLYGFIRQVYDDSFLFQTRDRTSLIHFERVREITPMEGQ